MMQTTSAAVCAFVCFVDPAPKDELHHFLSMQNMPTCYKTFTCARTLLLWLWPGYTTATSGSMAGWNEEQAEDVELVNVCLNMQAPHMCMGLSVLADALAS